MIKKINFTKMAGAGNDFIVVDVQKNIDYKNLAKKVCDRTNGIGADGLLVLDKSKKSDYKMRIINPDGSEAEMCGNGARCLAAYITKNKKPKKQMFSVETLSGEILCRAKKEIAIVRLKDPKGYKDSITLSINKQKIHVSFIDTGVPHIVIFVDKLENINVSKIGRDIRFDTKFKPKGTNVNFIEQINKNLIDARTYERGVENETKACGTGSVASAIIAYLKTNPTIKNKQGATMKVKTKSGEILEVCFDIIKGTAINVWLLGSAKFIAKGEYYV
ncbi:MAG: diaminopimelate epimerase [Candidatus Zapsychrus exili]|nr:diaminopimelate epimerase [Candidatus Zapsychrus exili]